MANEKRSPVMEGVFYAVDKFKKYLKKVKLLKWGGVKNVLY